jgi:alginate O-acetyltransferase complex protein AlgI
MVFSSVVFLFLFLPLILALYFLTPRAGRNGFLLLASALFYFWGETWLLAVMLGSAGLDFACAAWMTRNLRAAEPEREARLTPGGPRSAGQRLALLVSLAGNLTVLGLFKYFDFGIDTWARLVTRLGLDGLAWEPGLEIALPLGISFYTFQSMSYTIDVYRGVVAATRRPVDFLCFVTMFPQLVAGPIVRYRDVAAQLIERRVTLDGFAAGVRRFAVGLGKKVLVANAVAVPADRVFALPAEQLTAPVAWFGLLCYTLQIYFDFSGYSDMAVGLGRMLGFRLPENFDYPYVAKSVREFWRRWHMTLSRWFRDYLYIPLGGSRRGGAATLRNLLLVFLLCGLWHGAAWNFVVWGLWHGLFLVLERLLDRGPGLGPRRAASAWLGHLYTLGVVMTGWVLFRADTLAYALEFLRVMVFGSDLDPVLHPLVHLLDPKLLTLVSLGALGSTPAMADLVSGWQRRSPASLGLARTAATAGLLLASAMSLSAGTHNPFIYFRF